MTKPPVPTNPGAVLLCRVSSPWRAVAFALVFVAAGVSFAGRDIKGADISGLSEGWYMKWTDRQFDAVSIASRALSDDPDDIDAHVLFISSWGLYQRDRAPAAALALEYRSWAQERGHDPVARIALAWALMT